MMLGEHMKTVFSFLKPYRWAAYVALFLMLVELAVELWQPLLMAKIIDDGILQEDMTVVITWGSVMIGISLLAFAAGITNSFFAAHVSQSYSFDTRQSMFKKVQAFSFANFNSIPTSSLITRMTNDVTQVQNTVFMSLRIMLRAPLLVVGGLIMALLVNVTLALVLAIAVPLLLLFLVGVLKKGGGLFRLVQEKLDNVNRVMRENLAGIKLIKAFVRRKQEYKRFHHSSEQLMDKTIMALRTIEFTMPVLLLVMNVSILVILWYGNIQVTSGSIQVGEVVAIVNYATRITGAFTMFSMIIMIFSRAKASAKRIEDVLQTEVDLVDSSNAIDPSGAVEGNIEFSNVSFTYPNTDAKVLQKISFKAISGSTIAILGATGAGKTSLVQLIPRLYDVDSGSVLIDGHDVRMMKADMLRKEIGYVPQESMLFTGTIRENLLWGKEHATNEDIIRAAQDAQIHETIMKFPMQYETKIGQKGVNLSGGQKQRLSIARALLRKPKILLLDDSTSALDLKTEARLLDALGQYRCTTFIITQKIMTAKEADLILLLDDGILLEQGSHHELLAISSLYRKIVASQFGEENMNEL